MNDEKTYQTERLGINLSPDHKHALELIAKDDRESLSTTIRRLILEEARIRGLWPSDLQEKPDPAAPPPPDPTESQVHP